MWTNLKTNNPYPAGARNFQILDNYFEGPISLTQMNNAAVRGNTVNLAGNSPAACLPVESGQNVELANNDVIGGQAGITVGNNASLGQPETHILVHHNRRLENMSWRILVQA